MIKKQFYRTRNDGVKLYRSFSDSGVKIRKVGTDEIYEMAVDVEGAAFQYEETTEMIAAVDMFEFGVIRLDTAKSVIYSGEIEIGVTIYIHAVGPASNVTIYDEATREVMKIDTNRLKTITGSEIVAGDDIVICTVRGQKSIYLFRKGEYINILNCLGKDADWFQLTNGDNVFRYTADMGAENLQFRVENRIAYEGV